MSMQETNEGVVLTVYVKPNSPKFEIELDKDEIVIHATEVPEKGKANKEIIKELTKLFHAPIIIASGATSKQKKLLLGGLQKTEVERILHNHPY